VWLECPHWYGLQNFHPPFELSRSSLYRAGGSADKFHHTHVPWSQVDKESADARGAEGNAMGGAGARGAEGIAKGAADARVAERNESGVEQARGLGEGSMEIGLETNLHRDGGEHASKPLASMEVSALLHNRSLFLNWV
jgi:hypothetical protein